MASSSSIQSLLGCVPGQLDSTQPSRILRHKDSILRFASFDAQTAHPTDSIRLQAQSASSFSRPRRIVIEEFPSGDATWRWVPNARLESGAEEGHFPRPVEISGIPIIVSQEQWDIYKLDPLYDCFVSESFTVITRVDTSTKPTTSVNKKHRRSSSAESSHQSPRKKQVISVDSDEEVKNMDVDPLPVPFTKRGPKPVKDQNRQQRREKLSRRTDNLTTRALSEDFPDIGKRKASEVPDIIYTANMSPLESTSFAFRQPLRKRAKTASFETKTRSYDAKRTERQRRRQERDLERLEVRRIRRENEFLRDAFADLPGSQGHSQGTVNGRSSVNYSRPQTQEPSPTDGPSQPHYREPSQPYQIISSSSSSPSASSDDDDTTRLDAIAESRRKLADLERDRPLWEAAAREREEREQRERQAQAERQARREAEARAERERKAQLEAEERRKADMARREQEAFARAERDRVRRQQRQWSHGPWTVQRALERYRVMSETFDSTKFSAKQPLTFEIVPWPILSHTFSVEDIDWDTVEKFFGSVRPLMRHNDYKTFIDKARIRFHPDRWRSRGLLKSMVDDAERGCIDVAVNTVAQAITPMWQELKN
ncbi:hypothetical protein DL96DRAFT_1709755 [Flagelloscypha sp. PMI_526]|nr:hypothetical protein DL96DRAFT_1709755 [Flagelloscypha sp. PMI_526]